MRNRALRICPLSLWERVGVRVHGSSDACAKQALLKLFREHPHHHLNPLRLSPEGRTGGPQQIFQSRSASASIPERTLTPTLSQGEGEQRQGARFLIKTGPPGN